MVLYLPVKLGNNMRFVTIFVFTIDEIPAIFSQAWRVGGLETCACACYVYITDRKSSHSHPLPCMTFCILDMGIANFNTSRAFFVVWILFAYIFFDNLAEICEKIDDCSCRKSNGKVISLRQIDGGSTPA